MKRALAVVALALFPLACGSDEDEDRTLTVLAASSLTDALTELETVFEADHEGVDVRLSFGGSAALVEQVAQGAPADVLVTADEANMDKVTDHGDAFVIARNRLTIIVEPGNPKGITGLADLARDDIVLVLCAAEVPCGRLGVLALERAGVAATPASLEENVKGVVSKITLGEADAGIGYVTDVLAADDEVDGVAIDIADDPELEAVYPMAVLDQSEEQALAQEWIDAVLADAGQAVLREHGFLAP